MEKGPSFSTLRRRPVVDISVYPADVVIEEPLPNTKSSSYVIPISISSDCTFPGSNSAVGVAVRKSSRIGRSKVSLA